MSVLGPGAWADEQSSAPGAILRIPGFPPIQLPPGTRAFGPGQDEGPGRSGPLGADSSEADIYHDFGTVMPGGGARNRVQSFGGMVVGPRGEIKPAPGTKQRAQAIKPAAPSFEEKQAQIRKALTPPPPAAVVRRKNLDDLYAKLAASKDEAEARTFSALIATLWMRSSSDTANLLMARAGSAAQAKNYPLALTVLDKLVELQPGWAEAWNRRATVRYLAGNLNGAIADVDRVLKIEPNHFAALNGLAMILQQTGFQKRALQVYRRELAIYPHQPQLEQLVEKLSSELDGQGI